MSLIPRICLLALLSSLAACSAADKGNNPSGDTDASRGGDTAGSTQTPAPTLSLPSGAYAYGARITVESPIAEAALHCTVDDTPPSASSSVCEPVMLTEREATLVLRAIAIAPGLQPSKETRGEYSVEPGMLVHFEKPADWGAAYIHYWDTHPHGLATTWPGLPMTAEGDGWYYAWLGQQDEANLVFNGGDAPQTADLYWNKPEGWFTDGDFWDVHPSRFDCCAFPGGKFKALVMSYDDGNRQDINLIGLFDTHGIKGTFHLNSGLTENEDKVHAHEIASVYADHEVSAHSVTHPYLDSLNAEELEAEILDDKLALEALVGYSINGLSYPFGTYSNLLLDLLPDWGFIYGRVVPATGDLRLPANLLLWRGSCHHHDAWDLAQQLLAHDQQKMALLFVWGHAWELDSGEPGNSWEHLQALCELLGGHSDIWYAGAGEVARYLNAIRDLEFSPDGDSVHNPSPLSVFIKSGAGVVELAPGASMSIAQ